MSTKNICPVCAYNDLFEPPYDENGFGSYEICPRCGFQFGNDDFPNKEKQVKAWRKNWEKDGRKWFSKTRKGKT